MLDIFKYLPRSLKISKRMPEARPNITFDKCPHYVVVSILYRTGCKLHTTTYSVFNFDSKVGFPINKITTDR